QRPGQADVPARFHLRIQIFHTLEGEVVAVKIRSELEFAPEEPRFSKRELIILTLGAELDAQPELLAAAGEVWRVKQVKITLAQFHEPNHGIHGAEPRAHREVARVLFFDANHHVWMVRDFG